MLIISRAYISKGPPSAESEQHTQQFFAPALGLPIEWFSGPTSCHCRSWTSPIHNWYPWKAKTSINFKFFSSFFWSRQGFTEFIDVEKWDEIGNYIHPVKSLMANFTCEGIFNCRLLNKPREKLLGAFMNWIVDWSLSLFVHSYPCGILSPSMR